MAWACHLGYTKRLRTRGHGHKTMLNNFLQLLIVLSYFSASFVSSFKYNCDPVEKCFCSQNFSDDEEWEIQCPRVLLEVYDITLKVKRLRNGDGYLTVICNPEKPEVSWGLVQGVNFKMDEAETNITKLTLQYCAASSKTNPNVLKDFFSQVNLSLENIKRFVFLPSPQFSTSFPHELFRLMPNLEILDLQMLNLTSIPDLSELQNLKELSLRDNLITTIDPDTFKSNPTIFRLDLSLNNITHLPDNIFPNTLEHLNLAKNNIIQVTPQTFSMLKLLEELVLTRNPLNQLHPDSFTNLKSLKALQIDSNKFSVFPKLHNLSELITLSISYRDDGTGIEFSSNEPLAMALSQTSESDSRGNYSFEFQGYVSDMPGLMKIIFANDGLTSFPILHNLPNLSTLLLNGNKIKVIPRDALKDLTMLKTLNLNNNQIIMVHDLGTPNLLSLDLSYNQLEKLSSSVFSKLENLITLIVSNNKIRTIDPKALQFQKLLIYLDLSHNEIEIDEPKMFDENLDDFFYSAFDFQSPLRYCVKLQNLDLSYNLLQTIFTDWKILFSDLKILNLSHNIVSHLHSTHLSFSSNDLTLNLSQNNISTIDMEHADFIIEDASKRVLRVIVDENPLNCDCTLLPFKTFQLNGIYFKYTNLTCFEPIWLQGIQVRSIPPTDFICPVDKTLGCPSDCTCWKIPANKTIAVDCSYRNLGDTVIPDVHAINGIWTKFYNYTLSLVGNNISDLSPDLTKNLTSRILKVNLAKNELKSLTFLNLLVNNNVTSFYLAENKFPCNDCDFHKLLRSNFKRVRDYNNMSCLLVTDLGYGQKEITRYFVDKYPEDQICLQMAIAAEVQAMIIASSLFLIFVVIFIAVYFRYGWALRAYLYSKGFGCCFGIDDIEDDQEKIYDAFVSYSHKDEDWVLSQLVTRLEEQEGFKLCLHFRDWTPGDWIPDQIVRSVDKSRRTVVILSKHFVESVWSRLEFKAAHSQALNEKANRLILVMMDDDLKDQDVKDNDLRVYMKMNTYLKYGDPWFWHKLKYALPHRKATSAEGQYLKHQQRERAIQLDKLRAKMENTIA